MLEIDLVHCRSEFLRLRVKGNSMEYQWGMWQTVLSYEILGETFKLKLTFALTIQGNIFLFY